MPVVETIAIEPTPVREALDEMNWSQETLAERAEVGSRTVSRFLNGQPISTANAEAICAVLGLDLSQLISIEQDPRIESQVTEIQRVLECIAYRLLLEHYRVGSRPHLVRVVPNRNIDQLATPSDIDTHLALHSEELIKAASEHPDSPLFPGFVFCEEELQIQHVRNAIGSKWYLLFDANDDSEMSEAGLGGQGVLSAHHKDLGLVVVVVVDYARNRLFSTTRYSQTIVASIINLDQDVDPSRPDDRPDVRPLSVALRPTTDLVRARVNGFFGKHDRLRDAGGYLGRLLDDEFKVIPFPFGGARGACLVADGTIDVCIERCRGMRYLDGLASLLILDRAGGVCMDLETGSRFSFAPDLELYDSLDTLDVARFEQIRRTFLGTCTLRLARAILELYR